MCPDSMDQVLDLAIAEEEKAARGYRALAAVAANHWDSLQEVYDSFCDFGGGNWLVGAFIIVTDGPVRAAR